MADEDKPETDFGTFTTDARFSVEDGEPVVRGIMLEPGAFQTSRGARIVTRAFIDKTMAKWVGKRMCVVDASHPDKPPVTVDVARITKTGVNATGQGVFEARPFKTTLARDTWELAREYGRLGVSIDGPISLAADRKTMLDIEPRYLAVLPLGDQAIPASYAEVGKFSAGEGAFDSFNPKDKEQEDMTTEEVEKLTKERDDAASKVKDAEAKFADANEELTLIKTQRDALLKEKNEAERLALLDETAKFAKKFGDPEPAKDAALEALRALRAGFAEKALAKFSQESKGGADLQKTVPPAAGEEKAKAAKPRHIYITD